MTSQRHDQGTHANRCVGQQTMRDGVRDAGTESHTSLSHFTTVSFFQCHTILNSHISKKLTVTHYPDGWNPELKLSALVAEPPA